MTPAPVTRIHYDDFAGVLPRFEERAEKIRAMQTRLLDRMEALRRGAWTGDNADRFYREMENAILPALNRLHSALCDSGEAIDHPHLHGSGRGRRPGVPGWVGGSS